VASEGRELRLREIDDGSTGGSNLVDNLAMCLRDVFGYVRATAVIWGPFVSALVAAFIVHFLTQSRDREKWILDCKKQEFKELLSGLATSYIASLRMQGIADEEIQRNYSGAKANALRIMRDRIYIANDLPLEEIAKRWSIGSDLYRTPMRIHGDYDEIRTAIVIEANKCVPKSTLQRLRFWRR
jgi:hypothetical protein